MRQNVGSTPNIMSVSQPCCPGSPKGPSQPSSGKDEGRSLPSRSGTNPRSDGAWTPKARMTARFAGTIGFSTIELTSKTHAVCRVLPYRLSGSPSFSPVDEGIGLNFFTVARSALLRHCTPGDGVENQVGGHEPVVPRASVDESGQALEAEGGGGCPRRKRVLEEPVSREVPFRPDGDEKVCRASGGTVSFHSGARLKTSVRRQGDAEGATRRRGHP